MPRRLTAIFRSVFRRNRLESEMQEEMTAHLDLAVERLKSRGMSEEEARRTARREFGNLPSLQEEAREARGVLWIESLLADVRFALRTFRRTPFTTATIVLILALGLGVNTALFTFIHSVQTLPPPGIEKDASLVRIRRIQSMDLTSRYGHDVIGMSFAELQEYAAHRDFFGAVAGWIPWRYYPQIRMKSDEPLAITGRAEYVTGNYFEVIGVQLALGPGFSGMDVDDPASPALLVVIDHASWERHFRSDPGIIGQSILVYDIPLMIVGVAPPRFRGVDGWTRREDVDPTTLWIARSAHVAFDARMRVHSPAGADPNEVQSLYEDPFEFQAIARLHPGVNPDTIPPHLIGTAERIAGSRTTRPKGHVRIDVVPLTANNHRIAELPSFGSQNFIASALTDPAGAFGVTLLILAIVCTNAGALLAAFALTRRREIVVRLALGASRARVLRQLLTESVLRSIIAGTFGALILWSLIPIIRDRTPTGVLSLAWEGILFTFGIALITGVLLGLLPALHATRVSIGTNLKATSGTLVGRRSLLPRFFVTAQIVFTLPLIVYFVALLIDGAPLWRKAIPSRIDEQVLAIELGVPSSGGNRAIADIRARFALTPGIMGSFQLEGFTEDNFAGSFFARAHPDDLPIGLSLPDTFRIRTIDAAQDYFEVMNLPIVLGEDLPVIVGSLESATSMSIVIDKEIAGRIWGEDNPIGRRMIEVRGSSPREIVVVGVVDESGIADLGRWELSNDRFSSFYAYIRRPFPGGSRLLIRTEGEAEPMIPTVRQIVREVAPGLSVASATTLASLKRERLMASVRVIGTLAAMGGLGLLLSMIGMYGVLSIAVGQRLPEIGTRMAMGASPWRIRRIFLVEGVILGILGLAIGIPFGSGFFYVIEILSLGAFRLPPQTDKTVTILASILVLAVILLASWLPSRRAASVDPMIVLRSE